MTTSGGVDWLRDLPHDLSCVYDANTYSGLHVSTQYL
jgi:hypothetical protein